MLIYVCSCCYNPEVLLREHAESLLSVKFVASRRKDDNPGYFVVEAGNSPPIFHNKNGVKKLKHDFLLKMGYRWEETRPASRDDMTGEPINPLGWWYEPESRKTKLLELVPDLKR
ncbi:MAG: hypothetical protein AAB824_00545 [Patescibacteria group bacterium]